MESVSLASEADSQAISRLFEGTCCSTGKAFKVVNRLLARRYVNHVHSLSGFSPSVEPPSLVRVQPGQGVRSGSPGLETGELYFDDLQGQCYFHAPGNAASPPTPLNSAEAAGSSNRTHNLDGGLDAQARGGEGCHCMFYVPLPKTYTVERQGMNDTWQVVATNGAKFTTGLLGEGIYLFATANEAAYFANLNNVSHIIICDVFLGRTLTVQQPVKTILRRKLQESGFHSVHLLQSGIKQVPQQELAMDALTRSATQAPASRPQDSSSSSSHSDITFYAVYHPDQVMPHFVVEVSPQGVPHRAHELVAGDVSVLEERELTSFVQLERIDDPDSSMYDEAMVRSVKASMEPKYQVNAMFRIHNHILKQRMFTALHDFQMRQSRLKHPCGQNVVLKFHGSPACLSIAKNGFNIATRPGMFGRAIYFADDPRKSCNFAPTGELLLCRVALGRSLTLRMADQTLTSEGLHQKGFDSITAPGSRVLCCCHAVNRTEYAIYDPDLAYPEYLIQFTKVIQKKTFRNPLCGDVLMYKVHTTLQALWAALFLTMLLLALYIFVIGITMAITTPTGCNKDVSDRSTRFVWIIVFTLIFALELLPITLCCCFRAVRPVQSHFGLEKGAQELLPTPLPTGPEADAADQPFTVSAQSDDGSGCKAGVEKKVPKMILRHMKCWILFWHLLILALCIVIFCINQVIQCPIHSLLNWDVYSVSPDWRSKVDVTQNQFANLGISSSTSTTSTWQVNFAGTKMFTTGTRTYCVAPLQYGGVGARCQQPYLALSSCSSVSNFQSKMQTASSSYSSQQASGLPDLPMIQQINLQQSPKQLITSWDTFQYYINDNQFQNINSFIMGNAATSLMAQYPDLYDQQLANISATNGWPLCGVYQYNWMRSPVTTYKYDNTVPLELDVPVDVTSFTTINNGTQSLEYDMVLQALRMGPPLQYSNSTLYEVVDLPHVISSASVNWQDQSTTMENWTIPGASNGTNTTSNLTVIFVQKSLKLPQVLLDFTRPRQYWQDQYTLTNWLLFIPLFVGVGLFFLVACWLLWLYWRHPSEERVQYGDYNRKRRFNPPPVSNHLPLDSSGFQMELQGGSPVNAIPDTRSPVPQLTTRTSPKTSPSRPLQDSTV